jgi:hypothetical protein
MDEVNKSSVHHDLRIVEAKLHNFDSFINSSDPVWDALDRVWDFVVKGGKDG